MFESVDTWTDGRTPARVPYYKLTKKKKKSRVQNMHNTIRAYPSSEFDVANTLAKWKTLETNEIGCSQGFCQKVVSRSCSVFKSLPASGVFCHLLITFANSLDPYQARQNFGPDLSFKLFDTPMVLKQDQTLLWTCVSCAHLQCVNNH